MPKAATVVFVEQLASEYTVVSDGQVMVTVGGVVSKMSITWVAVAWLSHSSPAAQCSV